MKAPIGSDRKIVTHPGTPGMSHAAELPRRPRVAVVGAGIAGLTAATALAERGIAVELFERERYLGGRVGGWPTSLPDGTRVTMSRGFHAFFRQYYNLRQLLRRTDPDLDRLVGLDDYPLVGGGQTDHFRGLPRTPPLNALAFVARSPTFRMSDVFRLDAKAALPLAAVSVPEIYDRLDEVDARSFLDVINFPHAARHLAFEVFSRSFFARPEEISAAEMATMFHLYFLGSAEGLLFDVPTDSFPASLWSPLQHYLDEHDVLIRFETPVTEVEPLPDGRLAVRQGEREWSTVDGVVLAADIGGLKRIVANSRALGDASWRDRVAALRTAPPFHVSRLWLDRPVDPARPAFLGTAGVPPLDNISVLERYEAEAAEWAATHGGSVVELHGYALTESDGVADSLRRRLGEVYPETARAKVRAALHERRADCPLFGLGDFARRPGVRTPHEHVVLAGDGIRLDLPVALMERAAATGWTSANRLLAGWGLAGHPLYTVPTEGRSALLRWLARRGLRSHAARA